MERFIFGYLFHGVTDFFEKKRLRSSYFQTFPFFEDQRMYVQTLLCIKADMELTEVDVYRTSSLSGLTSDGKAYVSANNLPYIHDYLKTRLPEMGSKSLFHYGRTYFYMCNK